MRTFTTLALRSLIALTLAFAAPAMAQDAATVQGQALIDEGVALRRSGDDEGALARFRAAYELTHSARARAQIALVEQALGRWIDAEGHLLEALGSQEAWIEERRPTLLAQLEVIRSHLGRVRIVGGVPRAAVTVDGEPVGSLPIGSALWVEPGPTVVEVRADGHRTFTRTITTAEGQLTTLEVELVPEVTSPVVAEAVQSRPAPAERSDGFPLSTLGWASIGIGGAALVVSAVTLALRNNEAEAFNAPACLADGLSRGENCHGNYDSAQMFESVSIATLVIGGLFAATGVALVLVDGTSSDDSSVSVACSPTVGGTWGIGCGGSF